MKAISVKLGVPGWISAEEVRKILGTFEEEVEPVDVRKKEREVNRIARFWGRDRVKL